MLIGTMNSYSMAFLMISAMWGACTTRCVTCDSGCGSVEWDRHRRWFYDCFSWFGHGSKKGNPRKAYWKEEKRRKPQGFLGGFFLTSQPFRGGSSCFSKGFSSVGIWCLLRSARRNVAACPSVLTRGANSICCRAPSGSASGLQRGLKKGWFHVRNKRLGRDWLKRDYTQTLYTLWKYFLAFAWHQLRRDVGFFSK